MYLIKTLLVIILVTLSVECFAERNIVIDKVYIISKVNIGNGVKLGGISDIVCENKEVFYILTDRGPSTKLKTEKGIWGKLLYPDFKPKIIRVVLDDVVNRANVSTISHIHGIEGHCSGKPAWPYLKEWPNYPEYILDPDNRKVSPDIDGIDPKGLVRLDNGKFIITEEYGPSILHNNYYLKEGVDAIYKRVYLLPQRRNNRGLEAVALSEDNKYLWTCLQSPIIETSLNVPFIVYDIENRKVIKEMNYRLEEDTKDGKICAMRRLDKEHVVVLEQSDTTNAKLFKFNVNDKTKTLFASMDKILPQMSKDITNNKSEKTTGLKLEGFCFIDGFTIAMVNDNDFNFNSTMGDKPQYPKELVDPEMRKSCLWILKLSHEF